MPAQSPPHPPEDDSDNPTSRARMFFWLVLGIAAAVSITGNATQALLHTSALPAVAVAVAVIPPLALLSAVHGVAVLSRAEGESVAARRVATALTVMIAAAAGWMSFTALRSLAVTAGVPSAEAWLWPLIVEGSVTEATIALLTLAQHARYRHAHTGPAQVPDSSPETTGAARAASVTEPAADQVTTVYTPTGRPSSIPATTPDTPFQNTDPVHTAALPPPGRANTGSAPDDADVHTATESVRTPSPISDTETAAPERCTRAELELLAGRLCRLDPIRRRDPAMVTDILIRRHLHGQSVSRIGREIGRSRSTVSRILSTARDLPPGAEPELPDPFTQR